MSPGSSGWHSLPSGSMILHVAAGRGFAHGARSHFEAGVVADEQGVLRLPVAVVDGQAVQLFPALYHRWVQRLPGRDGVTDGGEVGAFQLGGLGEEAVLGRGLAEDGDVVALHQVQALRGVEAALVEEDLRPLAPRPQEDVPDALGPARPRSAPKPVAFLEIQPVPCLHPGRVRVSVGVQGAFGMLCRPRRVEDERALVRRRILGCKFLGSSVHEILVRIPAVALLAQRDEVSEIRDLPAHLLDLFYAFRSGDDGHGARVLGPELQVAGPELGGAGDGYGPQLQEAREDGVPLGHLAEEDHHPVAAAYAQPLRRAREPVREDRELGEVEAAFLPARAEPDHGRPVLRRPPVYHVAPEVEPLRRLPVEGRVGLLVIAYVGHDTHLSPKVALQKGILLERVGEDRLPPAS